MTHKEEVKLNRIQWKLETEKKIVDNLLKGCGDWGDGTGKDKLVLRVYEEEREVATIHKSEGLLTEYYITIPDWKMKMEISDEDLKAILKEGVEKVKAAKAKAKQEADGVKQKKSKIGYMDVFKRVADYIRKNGYTISTPKDEQEPIVMKVGTVILKWNNVKDFVSAKSDPHRDWDKEGYISIFRVISFWETKYYKLAYPSLRKLVNKLQVLREVNRNAILPVAVMKELNRLKV